MEQVHKTSLAEQDLIEIWLYTYNEWGELQADLYLDSFEQALDLIAGQPRICRLREEFDPPVRIYLHQRHLIVYWEINDGIEVIRVLHEGMDVDARIEE
jgi:Plasmid stabilization system protein